MIPLRITRLGHRGDGIAEDGTFVPFTLPGELVTAEGEGERGRLVEVIEASPDRVAPICRHFGTCGGCALQHMAEAPMLAFKRDMVIAALGQRGLEAEIEPTRPCPPASRRRAVFAAKKSEAGTAFGYHARLSNALVDIAECPILVPALQRRIAALRALVTPLLGPGEAAVTVLATETGLDVALSETVSAGRGPGAKPPRHAGNIARIAAAAAKIGIARLTVFGETIVLHAAPALPAGRARLLPPPGGFVQASHEAEAILTALVLEGIGTVRQVADLFAGSGTFALRLAERAAVTAVEGDRSAIAALDAAARAAPNLRPVAAQARDLFRRPLRIEELAPFDAVLFDPPRAGATAQAEALAASRVPKVVGVSCNPATFARDARTLVDGGYRLTRVVPVDQFVFSPHIELVGMFER